MMWYRRLLSCTQAIARALGTVRDRYGYCPAVAIETLVELLENNDNTTNLVWPWTALGACHVALHHATCWSECGTPHASRTLWLGTESKRQGHDRQHIPYAHVPRLPPRAQFSDNYYVQACLQGLADSLKSDDEPAFDPAKPDDATLPQIPPELLDRILATVTRYWNTDMLMPSYGLTGMRRLSHGPRGRGGRAHGVLSLVWSAPCMRGGMSAFD
jgi:hypothetical protein